MMRCPKCGMQPKSKLAVTDLGRWIVVNAAPTGNSDDVLFCETREDATTVARRFCEQTGRTYYVARAVGKVRRPEPSVKWEDLNGPRD